MTITAHKPTVVSPHTSLDFPRRSADLFDRILVAYPHSPYTLADIDRAIQSEAETWCEREGVPRGGTMPAFDSHDELWDSLLWDVVENLGMDYDVLFDTDRHPAHDKPALIGAAA